MTYRRCVPASLSYCQSHYCGRRQHNLFIAWVYQDDPENTASRFGFGTKALAIKKVLVALLESVGMTQGELAEKLQTSRTQVRRLLDPENTSITLATLQRAADVTGHRLVIGFKPVKKQRVAVNLRHVAVQAQPA